MKVNRIAQSFEEFDALPATTEERFKQGASLKEGVAGQLGVDTTYEQGQAVLSTVQSPRSDRRK